MLARVSSSARGGRNSAAMTEGSVRSRSTIDGGTVGSEDKLKVYKGVRGGGARDSGPRRGCMSKSPDACIPEVSRRGTYRHRLEVSPRQRQGPGSHRRRLVSGAERAPRAELARVPRPGFVARR